MTGSPLAVYTQRMTEVACGAAMEKLMPLPDWDGEGPRGDTDPGVMVSWVLEVREEELSLDVMESMAFRRDAGGPSGWDLLG